MDEEELVYLDLEDEGLDDWESLDAIIAEAREISAAEARNAAYAARMVFDGGFGAVGAAPGPRGPGDPGRRRRSRVSMPVRRRGSGRARAGYGAGLPGAGDFADAVAGPR